MPEVLMDRAAPFRTYGSVTRVSGSSVEVRGLRLRVGDVVEIESAAGTRIAEVVAVTERGAAALLLGTESGVGFRDRVRLRRDGIGVVLSDGMVGRVIDALGQPMDGLGPIEGTVCPLDAPAPNPLDRNRIHAQLSVGVKVIDTLCVTGRGQRLGIFGGSGVGKSTLLGMMARGTEADVTVVALVGERGREVREFIEDELGPDGMRHSVVVVATSDQPALLRVRAGFVAARIAEFFADSGREVLLLVDSLTRMAMAQREVGLAAGEPPTARGYTPSVFSMMPRLLERAGPRTTASVTGFYTVLVDGDDMNDPIADSARSILDGHIVLDRRLAIDGRFPAVDPLASLSRLAAKISPAEARADAVAVRSALAAVSEVRDLVEVGAYVAGTNPRADRGLAASPDIVEFFKQASDDLVPAPDAHKLLAELVSRLELR